MSSRAKASRLGGALTSSRRIATDRVAQVGEVLRWELDWHIAQDDTALIAFASKVTLNTRNGETTFVTRDD